MYNFTSNAEGWGRFRKAHTLSHVRWTTFNFNRNKLETVSAQVISSYHRGMDVFRKYLQKLISKGFQSIIEGHKYADVRQLLSLSMFLLATIIKQTMLKIMVIEN